MTTGVGARVRTVVDVDCAKRAGLVPAGTEGYVVEVRESPYETYIVSVERPQNASGLITLRPGEFEEVQDVPHSMKEVGPRCRCGHRRSAHEHYRLGSDCALCRCNRFRRDWLRALLHRFGEDRA